MRTPRPLVIVTLAILAAFALWGWLALHAPGAPLAPVEPRAVVEREELPQRPLGSEAPSPTQGARVVLEDEGAAARSVVEGQVARELIAHGSARLSPDELFPGARVVLALHAGLDRTSEPLARVELETDEDGRFRWEGERPSGAHLVRAQGAVEGFQSRVVSAQVLAGEQPPELTVTLRPLDSTIEGVVQDEQGAPIAGATVDGHRRERVTTDEGGGFRMSASSRDAQVHLSAWAEGFAEVRQVVQPQAAGVLRVTFFLPRALRVHGRVVDGAGLPIAGARVSAHTADRTNTVTGEDGLFELAHLDPGEHMHFLWFLADGFVDADREVRTQGSTPVELEVVLERGVVVSGVALDEDSRPLEGVSVGIGRSSMGSAREPTLSGPDGTFELSGLPRGRQAIYGDRKDLASTVLELDVPEVGAELRGLVLRLSRGREIAGRVLDPEGEPLAAAELYVAIDTGQPYGNYVRGSWRSDEQGAFRIAALPAVDLRLEIAASGFLRRSFPVPAGAGTGLELRLERAGRLSGRVVDAESGAPVTSFRVRLARPALLAGERELSRINATWVDGGVEFSDAEGRWSTGDEALEPGTVTAVEISAIGFAPALAPRVLVGAGSEAERIETALARGGSLTGRVLEAESGRAIAGAWVRLADGDSALYPFELRRLPSATTDAAGRFELENAPPGPARLVVDSDERPALVDGPFEILAGATPERTIELTAAARISGRLLDGAGVPRAGEQLEVSEFDPSPLPMRLWTASTDSQGRFAFPALAAGRLSLSHESRGEGTIVTLRRVTVELSAGEMREVELGPEGDASLAGRLVGALPPNGEATIWLVPGAWDGSGTPERAWGALAEHGHFTIEGLPPGTYTLRASARLAGSFALGSRQVELATAGPASVELELAAPR